VIDDDGRRWTVWYSRNQDTRLEQTNKEPSYRWVARWR
jgi:hypothetical protein